MKKSGKKSNKLFLSIMSILIAVIFLFSAALNYLALTVFDGLATSFFGTTKTSVAGGKGSDSEYYTSDFENAKALSDYEMNLGVQIAQEGVVLLKNEDSTLPLEKGNQVSLFGTASVELNYGGSGSGAGSVDTNTDLKTACTEAGLEVNETLWDFYKSGNGAKDSEGNEYGIGPGSIQFGADFDWSINECPADRIQSENGLADTFEGTTAVYVIARSGGEDGDLPRDMAAYGGKSGQHYLELDETEKGVVEYLNKTFDDVIIIVNTNNPMELGWVNDYDHIKAVINAPGLGRSGAQGLANVLVGYDGEEEISPSGHLADTFVYDNFSSPAMQNMGDYHYKDSNYRYVSYSEGIYVGYRYYETRYEDAVMGTSGVGTYDYDNTVMYPFGYGLSYTSFEWSGYTVSEPDENGDITVSVTVTNTGDRSGKEVVQLYMQSPYTDYDKENRIEKASAELVGYAKTENLQPGESEEVQIDVNKEVFKTYDTYGAGTYVIDAGEYYLTVADNAHDAVNNILKAKGYGTEGNTELVDSYTQDTFDAETYAADSTTGVAVQNQFTDAELADITYLTRSDWQMMDGNGLRYGAAGTTESPMEQNGVAFEHELSAELKEKLDSTDSLNPEEEKYTELPRREEENNLELVDMRGLDYADELWEDFLAQLSLDEVRRIVYVNGYSTLGAIDTVNKPKSVENDGPAGINDFQLHESIATGDDTVTMNWPAEVLLASTWNLELAEEMGVCVGEDGLYSNTVGWYGPAMNIHRTPFAGRNFEYYSEDSCLSGTMAKVEVNGAARKGLITYIKHFALNDQETNRSGIVTWSNEQAIREIYLKPFETAIKNNEISLKYIDSEKNQAAEKTIEACMAIMSSYNRLGATWSGGNYHLLTGVARGEWGFNGTILTDYNQSQEFMDTEQMLAAGGDSKLRTLDSGFSVSQVKRNPQIAHYAYEAAHRYMYAQANSAIVNNMSHGSKVRHGIPYYKIMLVVWDILATGVIIFIIIVMRRRIKNSRTSIELCTAEEADKKASEKTENKF